MKSLFRTIACAFVVSGLLFTNGLAFTARPGHPITPPPPSQFEMITGQAVRFAVSPAIRDLPPEPPPKIELSDEEAIKDRPMKIFRSETGAEGTPDEAIAPVPNNPDPGLGSPGTSFDALSNADNFALFGFRVSPPDTDGDVGPNHYVQIVNLAYRVYDKTGAPLIPARRVSSIFAALGGPCATRDDGDPIVLYDPLADRWMISQFCTIADPNNHQVIAISKTPDPTGEFFLYDFQMPNNKFNDYPKFGVWPNAYYMTDNQFNQAGTAFLGGGMFAFDRVKMLAGDPTASFIYFDSCPSNSACVIGGMLPADLDGLNPPPAGAPGIFSYFTADEFGDPADGLRIFFFHADFANPSNSTFLEQPFVPVAAFDPRSPSGRDDIEQPPPAVTTTASLDAISDRLMFRLAYRNFGSHESLVVNHTVNVGTGTTIALHQAGVRYYELRRVGAGNFGVNEQATFAPDTHNRWMGSAAQDNQGNLAVGYSVSSLTVFPSIRYAGRLATDPPNGLFQGERSMTVGTGVQTSTGSRWGDYSSMSVDPADDCTFWYTQQYYTAASQATSAVGWLTSVANFKFEECTPAPKGTLQVNVTNAMTGLPLPGAIAQTSDGFTLVTNAAGTASLPKAPSTFNVTASRFGFTSATANGVTVNNGSTTVVDIALTPVPIIMTAGAASITSESCSPNSGSIDPGEQVSVSFTLKNIGAAATTNLVGTLLPAGGVTMPGPPQSYGTIAPNGSTSRTFSFTADAGAACGSTLTATLQLQDGMANLGTVSFDFTLGTLGAPVSVSYSSGDLNVPIPDVSSVEIPINVPDTGSVDDVNVSIRLNHTFDGDLVIALVHPDGTVVNLAANRGGAGDNFGTGATSCTGTPTVFDDQAASPIASGVAPFAGAFRPDQPLSALNGKPSNGTWKIRISDTAALDVGTFFCGKLEINRRRYVCCPYADGTPLMSAAGTNLIAESCNPNNGAIDPDETVTVNFALNNVGTASTTNLVATLLPGGGVNSPSGPQSYGMVFPTPVGPSVSRSFTFVPSGTCGGQVTATLALEDVGGAGSLGTVTYNIRLGATVTGMATFSNAGAITILDTPRIGGIAPSSPYPSTINVSGVTGTVSKVTVTVKMLNHTFPADIDMLLVGPSGQRLLLMSDVGGGTDAVNATLTFDDTAAPIGATVVSGTFRPTNIGTGDVFPAPAPAGPYPDPQLLSVFNGVNPNGTWSLYVVDDVGVDAGSIAGGWELNFTTADPVCCQQACTLGCPTINASSMANACGVNLTLTNPNSIVGSCGVISCVPPSGSFFPVGTTSDTCTGTSTSTGMTTASCNFNVVVADAQPPSLTNISASPSVLWPPEHQMVDVMVNYTVNDNCGALTSLNVTSNEPINGLGDGDTAPDWIIVDANRVRLRAERSGKGTGRIYTIHITAVDAQGNSTTRTVNVTVPHSQR